MRRNFEVVLVAAMVCAIAALLPVSAMAQNSGADQYIEQVPGADGDKPADSPGGDQGGRPDADDSGSGGTSGSGSGGTSSSGTGSDDSSGGSSSDGDKDKKKKKKEDKEEATDVTGSADAGDTGDDDAGELAKASVPPTDGGDGGGSFPLVAITVLALLAGGAFAGYWWIGRRNRRSGPGEPATE